MDNLPNSKKQLAERKKNQAQAIELYQQGHHDPQIIAALDEITRDLRATAQHLDTAKEPVSPVIELPLHATEQQILQSRAKQAVRIQSCTYLPKLGDDYHTLPNALLRSSLFSAVRTVETTPLTDAVVASLNNVRILQTGCQLSQFDRQVYATLLDFYKQAPLSKIQRPDTMMHTSMYAFVLRMGTAYSSRQLNYVVASLQRLHSNTLILNIDDLLHRPIPLLPMFQIQTPTGEIIDIDQCKGNTVLSFGIDECIAELYGPGCWSAIDKSTSKQRELAGWLGHFYATHKHPRPVTLESVARLSGYPETGTRLKTAIKTAMSKLQTLQLPYKSPIVSFAIDGTSLIVEKNKAK